MKAYEVMVIDINPCGGEAHARKQFLEVEIESPERYVEENGRYPIQEIFTDLNGDTVIVTGKGNGYSIKYIFMEA